MKNKFHISRIRLFVFFLMEVVFMVNLTTFFVPSTQAALKARIYKGEEVQVVLGCQISTDTIKAGTQFTAKVKEDFKKEKGEDIYIYKGDPVFATIEKVKKPGWYGKSGELVIRFDSTMSSGGTFIPLKGELKFKGKGRKTWAYVLFFVGWAIHGKNVEAKAEETCVTQVNVKDYMDIEFKP